MARRPSPAEQQERRTRRKNHREVAHERRAVVRVATAAERASRREEMAEQVVVTIPERRRQPETVIADLGPTNSGKTHDTLQFLMDEGRGTFAAPLRMLAQESYHRMVVQMGADNVGLITGEERINDTAPLLCCTAEMAPRSGHALGLDEVHWAQDRDRGFAWTRLLLSAEYRHIRLIGAADALPLIRSALPQVEVRLHERLSPLEYVGERDWKSLEPGTVLVAFSRKSVLNLRSQLALQYGRDKVACLYGAMPLAARQEVIARAQAGEVDLLVATDVLGHGINLPVGTVLFAETCKFDGEELRNLRAWETAQISGRAGRFGLTDRGETGVVSGLDATPSGELVQRAMRPMVPIEGDVMGYRRVSHGRLRASLEDLGVQSADELGLALEVWEHKAIAELDGHPWLTPEPTDLVRARLKVATRAVSRRAMRGISVQQAWQLASSPLDPEDEAVGVALLSATALELSGAGPQVLDLLPSPEAVRKMRLLDAESAARMATGVRWIIHAFPELGLDDRRAARVEAVASERVITCLNEL